MRLGILWSALKKDEVVEDVPIDFGVFASLARAWLIIFCFRPIVCSSVGCLGTRFRSRPQCVY